LLPVVAVVAVLLVVISYAGAYLLWKRRRVLISN
jgi:uncharacterized iron-regulated membrane protein